MSAAEFSEVERESGVMLSGSRSGEWLTPAQVAERWGVDPKTARRWLRDLDRRANGELLVRAGGGVRREHFRVSAAALARFEPPRKASAEQRLLRSHESRLSALEDWTERRAP